MIHLIPYLIYTIFLKNYNLPADFSGSRIWSYVKQSLPRPWHSSLLFFHKQKLEQFIKAAH